MYNLPVNICLSVLLSIFDFFFFFFWICSLPLFSSTHSSGFIVYDVT